MIRVVEKVKGFANVGRLARSKAGIWIPQLDTHLSKRHNVLVVIDRADGSRELIATHNIVTDAGDIYYAQKAMGETPTNTFNRFTFGTGKTAAWAKSGAASQFGNLTGSIAGSIKAEASTYPKTNDGDASNTGAGLNVMTHLASYTSTDFTSATAVTDGVITITSAVSGSPILTGFTLGTSFTLATGDSVKVFVNHTQLGV
jgi:hypothetical protein